MLSFQSGADLPYEIPIPGLTKARHHELLNSNEPPDDIEVNLIRCAISKNSGSLLVLDAEITQVRDRLQRLDAEYLSLSSYQGRNRIILSRPGQIPPESRARLSSLDDLIPRVRDQFQRLEIKRASLLRCQVQNRGILSPLRRLAPELLSEIHRWTLPSSARKSSLRRGFHARESPWVLTHVNRYWREVAVTNPSLWSLITIFYRRELDPTSSYPIPMVETQLSRAHNLDLHFFGYEDTKCEPQVEMFQCLARHSSRWEQLSLQLTSALSPLLAGLRGSVPLLRKVFIQWDGGTGQATADPISFLETAPSLVDVGIHNDYRFVPIFLPAQQLTRYQLDAPWDVHRGTLTLARNLTEARIGVHRDHDSYPWPPGVVDLPLLRHLASKTPKVLDYIRVPALEDLALSIKWREESCIVDTLYSLIHRSSCTIRYLCLSMFTAHIAVAILHAIPSIIELRIIIASYNFFHVRTLMETLTVSEMAMESEVVAPQLRSISLGCPLRPAGTQIDYDSYLAMIKSRWEADYCALTTSAVLLHSGPGPDAITRDRLSVLCEDGMDFRLVIGTRASDVMDYWLCHSRY
ncbi:hypothetical protein K438DRAFT_698404 [Mycena galopus ATCC 62051]|nr:hypothetical protein K438DRAFT_698404 [Mycena galopus ATCC 62051]